MWHKEISTFNELYGHVSSSNPLRALPCLAPKLYTRRITSMQSMIQFMRWLGMRLDTARLSRDYLIDTSVKRKPCKINKFKNYMGVHDKNAHPYFYSKSIIFKILFFLSTSQYLSLFIILSSNVFSLFLLDL